MTTLLSVSQQGLARWIAALAAVVTMNSVVVLAQPVDPTVDEFPVYDSADAAKSYQVRLRFTERFDVSLESVELRTQLSHGKSAEPPLLRIQMRDLEATVLNEFNGWHPLWAFTSDAAGQEHLTLLTNRVGRIVAPFHPAAAEMLVYDVAADDTLVATVDLLPTSHTFCHANPSDPDCAQLPNRLPVCSAGGPYSQQCAATSNSFTLDGSGSSDLDQDPLGLTWTGPFAPSPVAGVAPTVTFTGVGTSTVQLAVSDTHESAMCTASVTVVDTLPPTLTAGSVTVNRCLPNPSAVAISASASDQCNATGVLPVAGSLRTVGATTVLPPIALGNSPASVTLLPGTATVEWTATDPSNNSSSVTQNVTVNVTENAATCCPPGSTVVQGGSGLDLIFRPLSNAYCVFGNGGGDHVDTGGGTDFIAGGAGGDVLDSGASSGDTVSGGTGDDWININFGSQTTLYGGPDNDVIDQNNAGVIYGNAGNDHIETAVGAHTIYPGPGRDTVHGGIGDDTIVIRDVCEVVSGEVLEGGLGNDTLITPVPVADLQARGAFLLGFQTIVVSNAERHLSECF